MSLRPQPLHHGGSGLRKDCISVLNFPMKSAEEKKIQEKIQDDALRTCVDKYQNIVYNVYEQ